MFSKLKQSTIMLMAVIIISKLVGMFRDIVLANYFGTSNVSDAYLIAVSVPTLLFYFIGHSLSTSYLPMYNKVKAKKGIEEGLVFSNSLLFVALAIATILVSLLLLFPQYIIKLFAAGFDKDTLSITVTFVRYSAFSLFCMTTISILSGYLQANSNFLLPAMISFPRNIVFIISVVIAAAFDVKFLGIGILLAYVAELVLLLIPSIRNGYRFNFKIAPFSNEMKETLYMVVPILIGVGVSQINKVIDKSIASTIITGGISALSYASIINNAVQEVLVTGIITVLFAKCAAWVAEDKHDIVKNKLSETIQTLSFLLIPASFGVIAVSNLIVKCVLCRGAFDADSVAITSGALCCYTVGLCFLAVRDTLVKVFYAYKETKITTTTSVMAILTNIVLNIVLSRFYGINGLALATSIAGMLQSVVLYICLKNKIGDFGIRNQISAIIKSLLVSIIMFIVIKVLLRTAFIAEFNDMIKLIISVVLGSVVYAFGALLVKIKTAVDWLRMIKTKIFR